MKTFATNHFPSDKKTFVTYFKLFYPMLIGSTLYALNGFIDNFMVGHIEQGASALAAVNSWTNILMGAFIGISAAGSVINAKYYFSGQYEKAISLFKFRMNLSLACSLIIATVAWITPDTLIQVFLKKAPGTDLAAYQVALDNSRDYMRVITFSWILIAFTSCMGNSLREIGHSKASMYWGYMTITTNVVLNSVFMYGVGMGVEGAALASVSARIVAFLFGIYWLWAKDTKLGFRPWSILKFDLIVIKDFLSKWYLFISFSTVILFVTLRSYFYDAAYPIGKYIGKGIGAMTIWGVASAIMNIFTTTFSAAGAMSANVVGKELSNGNTEQALIAAKKLKGFMTFMAACLALALALVSISIPYAEFLSEKKLNADGSLKFDNHTNLLEIRNSLWIISFYYPMWIWFTTSYRSASTGKKGFWFSFVDMIVSGPIQLGWAATLAYGIVPNVDFMHDRFWCMVLLFFASDYLKLIGMEFLFYKFPWNTPISHENEVANIALGNDEITEGQIDGR